MTLLLLGTHVWLCLVIITTEYLIIYKFGFSTNNMEFSNIIPPLHIQQLLVGCLAIYVAFTAGVIMWILRRDRNSALTAGGIEEEAACISNSNDSSGIIQGQNEESKRIN